MRVIKVGYLVNVTLRTEGLKALVLQRKVIDKIPTRKLLQH